MDFPKFIEDAIATRPIYWHLRENENAKLKINHAIADFEEKLALERRGSYMWAFEVSALNEKAVLQYDRPWGSSDFEEYAPVTWKKGAEHLSDLIYLFCNAVAESARSASELHNLKDCLDAMSESYTYAYYDSKLDSWEEDGKFREEFRLLFRVAMASRIDLLIGSCWHWYRKRLSDTLDQAQLNESDPLRVWPDATGTEATGATNATKESWDAERRSIARKLVVEPILKIKGWTRSRWASEAGVGKNCAYDYLDAKRNLSAENRRALAEVLDLRPEDLPNE